MAGISGRATLLLALGLVAGASVPAFGQDPALVVGADVPYSDPAGALAGLVTVRAIEDPFTGFREDSPPGVGLRYVQLNVAFEAAEDKPFEAHPSHIVLQDTEGFLWAYASISRPPDAKPQDLESQELEAGDRVSGAINYIVPESAIIDEVLYQPSSGGRVITLVDLSVTRSAPSPSETSAPPSPTADLLVVSLIQEQDLPRDLTAQDVSEPPAFDIDDAAFTAHGGSRAVSRTWQSDVGSIRALFDFRLEFPTTEDAIAYLDAAEPILSEAVASGLSLVEDPQPIGEDARHYSGEVEAEGQTIQFENYLFRVGPVVAKVFIAGIGMPEDAAELFARTAEGRMRIFKSLVAPPSPAP